MILLEVANRAVEDLLTDKFADAKESTDPKNRDKVNYTLGDFDSVVYHVTDLDRKKILVSIQINYFKELEQHGVFEYLKKQYGDMLEAKPESGYNVTLSVDLDRLPQDHAKLARQCALLKRNCMAALFIKFFDLHSGMTATSEMHRGVVHFSPDETLYIQAIHDRVTVIFSTMFKDADDMMIGKMFLQEFAESRRRMDRAPQVLYSHRVPPAELKGTNAVVSDSVAYLTIVLQPRNLKDGAARDNTVDLIHTLRNYLHYHIKCAKAYLQMRMRAKTSELIKIINRARPQRTAPTIITVPPMGEYSYQQQRAQIEGSAALPRGVQSG